MTNAQLCSGSAEFLHTGTLLMGLRSLWAQALTVLVVQGWGGLGFLPLPLPFVQGSVVL